MLFTTGQGAGQCINAFPDARKQVQQLFIVLRNGRFVAAREGAHQKVLAHRHGAKQAACLRHAGDATADDLRCAQAQRGLPIKDDVTALRLEQTQHNLHGGGFAAGVATEQTDNLATPHFKLKIKVHLYRPVEGVDMGQMQ